MLPWVLDYVLKIYRDGNSIYILSLYLILHQLLGFFFLLSIGVSMVYHTWKFLHYCFVLGILLPALSPKVPITLLTLCQSPFSSSFPPLATSLSCSVCSISGLASTGKYLIPCFISLSSSYKQEHHAHDFLGEPACYLRREF